MLLTLLSIAVIYVIHYLSDIDKWDLEPYLIGLGFGVFLYHQLLPTLSAILGKDIVTNDNDRVAVSLIAFPALIVMAVSAILIVRLVIEPLVSCGLL